MNVMKLINLPSLFTVFRTVIISIKVKPSHFICFTDTRHVMPTSMATTYKLNDRPSSRFSFFSVSVLIFTPLYSLRIYLVDSMLRGCRNMYRITYIIVTDVLVFFVVYFQFSFLLTFIIHGSLTCYN